MPNGVPTPENIELEWRKHYLVTGNVSGSAKAVGLPVNTGYELRDRALADPEFVKARDRIRAKLEPDAEQMAVCIMQMCMERVNRDPDEMLAKLMVAAGAGKGDKGGRVHFQDPGPQYAAAFAKLFASVIAGRRFEAEANGQIRPPGEVKIVVTTTREDLQADELGD